MGLDTVELVLRVEEVFAIAIPNEAASNLRTVGDLHEFVLGALRTRGESPEPQQIWDQLKHIFVKDHAIPAGLIVPTADVVHDLGLD